MNIDTPKTFHFVRQKVTDEESIKMRLTLDPKGFYPAGNPREWMVDEEHGITFASLGGRGDHREADDMMPNYYLVLVGKHVIRFESRYIENGVGMTGNKSHDVFNAQCPIALSGQVDWLKLAIEEGLFADWHSRYASGPYTLGTVDVNSFEFKFV
jgi:hypothetical protein